MKLKVLRFDGDPGQEVSLDWVLERFDTAPFAVWLDDEAGSPVAEIRRSAGVIAYRLRGQKVWWRAKDQGDPCGEVADRAARRSAT